MTVLDVPGPCLHYEIRGSGRLLALIPGASGTAEGFRRVTEHLTANYTVALYDRRGLFPQPPERRARSGASARNRADDLRRLIEHVDTGPAIVFGASSGGIVACEVLARYPAVVQMLVPFEPPAVRYLPNGQTWLDFFTEVYDLYRQSGVEQALRRFRARAFAEADRQAMAQAMSINRSEHTHADVVYWFEHELRQYPAALLDWAALATHSQRVLPAAGTESRGYPAYQVAVEVSKRLHRQLVQFPGGHLGCMTQPAEFAFTLIRALTREATDHADTPSPTRGG